MHTKSPFDIPFISYNLQVVNCPVYINRPSIKTGGDLTMAAFDEMMFGKPKDKNVERITIPAIKRIVYHNPATIVFWQDETKTVVKCMDGEPFEKYAGFCAALAKKVFGSTSKAKKVAGAKKKDEVEE